MDCAAPSHLSLQVKGHRLSFVRDSERKYHTHNQAQQPSTQSTTMHCEGSIWHGRVLLPNIFQRKVPLRPLLRPVDRNDWRTGGGSSVNSLGTLIYIKDVSLILVCQSSGALNAGRPKLSSAASVRARHWLPRVALRSHKPSNATVCW